MNVIAFQILHFLSIKPTRKRKNSSTRSLTKKEIQKFLDTLEGDDRALKDSEMDFSSKDEPDR